MTNNFLKIISIIFFFIFFPFFAIASDYQALEKKINETSLSMEFNKMKELEKEMKELLKNNPSDFMANFYLGKLYFSISEYFELNSEGEKGKNWDNSEKYIDTALIYFDSSIKFNEKYFDSHFYKYLSLIYKMRHFTGWNFTSMISVGISVSKEKNIMLTLGKDNPKRYLAEGVGMLFKPEFRGGGPLKARPVIEQAIKLDPSYDEAYFWLAKTYIFKDLKNKEPEKAKENFKKALQLSPNNNKYKIEIARIH